MNYEKGSAGGRRMPPIRPKQGKPPRRGRGIEGGRRAGEPLSARDFDTSALCNADSQFQQPNMMNESILSDPPSLCSGVASQIKAEAKSQSRACGTEEAEQESGEATRQSDQIKAL